MNKKALAVVMIVMLVAGGGGAWWAQRGASHEHQMVSRIDDAGGVYYTCAMHPQVRLDAPGNCPICNMKLTRRQHAPTAGADGMGMGDADAPREVLYWYDPMRPEAHFDEPGPSPFMDMALVPKYADDAGSATLVSIDPRMAQNLGVRTAEVSTGTFWQRIDAVGSVAIDENRIAVIEARAQGWVERLNVRAVGDPVRSGQVLAGLYAPEVLAAQEELALAVTLADATLIDAARARLRLLNAGRSAQRQDAIVAPQDGVVTELMVRQGAAVTPGMPLMTVADLSSVWVQIEIPEAQAQWVAAGRPAEARLRGLPGRVFEGRVDYVYPTLDTQTRTLRARLVIDNADGLLKPGMFAEATVFGGPRHEVLLVPSEALIRTGTRDVVMIALDAGRYRPAAVRVGPERDQQTVILDGLEAGQRVVVSGQFLIDSEASLLGAYRRMGAAPAGDRAMPDRPMPSGAEPMRGGHDGHDGHEAQADQMSGSGS